MDQWNNLPVLSNSDGQPELPELDKRWWNVNWPWLHHDSFHDSMYRVLGADLFVTMNDAELTVPRG